MTSRSIAAIILASAAFTAYAQGATVVKTIEVRGTQNVSKDAVLAAMTRLQVGKVFSRADADADEEAIFNIGLFRDVKISSRDQAGDTEVFVDISENPLINEIRVLGNTVVSTEKITAMALQFQTLGRIWNNRNGAMIRDAIVAAYQKEGTFAQLLALEPDAEVPGALLISMLEPRVGEITFVGLSRTKTSTLSRLIKTKPGEVYRQNQWQSDLLELVGTQWFEKIDPEPPQATDRPGVFNLRTTVAEAKTAQIGAGVAIDPSSRLVGNLYWSDSNFRGSGQNVGVNLSQAAAGGGPSAELAYSNRFFDRWNTAFSAQVFSKVVYNFVGTGTDAFGSGTQDDFNERRTGLSVSFNRPLNDTTRAGIGLTAQTIKTINLKDNLTSNDFLQQDGDLAYLSFNYDIDTRRPTSEPFYGRFIRFQIEPGISNITKIGGSVANDTGVLGSNTFLRTSLEYRQYWSKPLKEGEPFDKPRPVLAARARVGNITGTVPFFEQFFMGGSSTLRGYDNQRFWGSQSFLSSVEYRYPLQKAFNIVGFIDYGGAWNGYGRLRDYDQSDKIKLYLGYGLGAAFKTPLGPIRIDFGVSQEGKIRTHFAFGTSF